MSILYCSIAVTDTYSVLKIRRTWRLLGIPMYSSVQVIPR